MSGPNESESRFSIRFAFCRSGVINMKPMSAFGVTMLKREQLRRFHRAHFLHERREIRLGRILFFAAEQLPLAILDSVKQMQAMPAFFGNQRGVFISHRA